MPLGDSITEGFDIDTTYRRYLQDMLSADDVSFDFVGSHGTTIRTPPDGGPTWGIISWQRDYRGSYDIDFEGHGGWQAGRTIPEVGYGDFMLAQQIGFDLPAYDPHVVLLMIGINDLGGGWARHGPWTFDESVENVVRLVDRTREMLPDAVIVAAPPTRAGITRQLDEFARLSPPILAALKARAANDKRLIVAADLHDDLTANDIDPDGIHPNATGARKLAAAWHRHLAPVLATCPSAASPIPPPIVFRRVLAPRPRRQATPSTNLRARCRPGTAPDISETTHRPGASLPAHGAVRSDNLTASRVTDRASRQTSPKPRDLPVAVPRARRHAARKPSC
jgi:lysophospholipase L1-like esterase